MGWRIARSLQLVPLHVPLLFNLDVRGRWSLQEDEIDSFMEEHNHNAEDNVEGDENDYAHPHQGC